MAPSAPPGADEGMQLVDKQQYIARSSDLVNDILDPFLKLTPVFAARHHAGQIQADEPFVPHAVRDIAGYDPGSQSFHDGRLAHARLSDETGVVLRPAAQDLYHPLDLILSPDDRVKLPVPGQFRDIPAVSIQGGCGSGTACSGIRAKTCRPADLLW